MKKLTILPVLFALALFSFSACSDDTTDGPTRFEVIDEALTQQFTGVAETRFVPVEFNGNFTYKMSDSDWCTAKRTGNGNVVTGINISVTANPSASPREATITLIATGAEDVVIAVKQSGAKPSVKIVDPASGSVTVARTGGTGKLTIKVEANFPLKFKTSEWIELFATDSKAGEYRFSVKEFVTEGSDPRSGEIEILPESAEIQWTEMTKIAVQQLGQLPPAPEAPESLPGFDAAKAAFADLYFTADGWQNAAPDGTKMAVKEGEEGTPSTAWSDATNSYVLSLGRPTYWIPSGSDLYDGGGDFTKTGGLYKKYLSVIYNDATGVYPNRQPEFAGADKTFTMEAWLKVTNAAEATGTSKDPDAEKPAITIDNTIYLVGSRDRHQNGNFHNKLGIGFRIGGDRKIRFFASTAGQADVEAVAAEPCTSDYVHLLCIRGNGKISLYIDGALQEETNIEGLTMPWTNYPAAAGADVGGKLPPQGIGIGGGYTGVYAGTVRCMEGEIAFYRWYDKALTAEEIAARYAAVKDHAGEEFAKIPAELSWLESVVENTADDLKEGMTWAIRNGKALQSNFDTTNASAAAWLDYVEKLRNYYKTHYQ